MTKVLELLGKLLAFVLRWARYSAIAAFIVKVILYLLKLLRRR